MENTPKTYKIMQTLGVLLTLLAVIVLVKAAVNDTGGVAASSMFWIGLLVYAAGRFIPWMKHG